MTAARQIGAAMALLAMTACAGAPIYNVEYSPGYQPGETRAQGPDVTVVVRGNPSTLPKAEFDRSVTDAMQGWSFWPDHFTTDGNPNAAYRVVMIFYPPLTAGGPTLCMRPELADGVYGVVSARVPVVAALCRGDYHMSLAEGSIGAADGPQGVDFRSGVGHITQALFPPHNPQDTGRSGCRMC
jgi:hypothetical protein